MILGGFSGLKKLNKENELKYKKTNFISIAGRLYCHKQAQKKACRARYLIVGRL